MYNLTKLSLVQLTGVDRETGLGENTHDPSSKRTPAFENPEKSMHFRLSMSGTLAEFDDDVVDIQFWHPSLLSKNEFLPKTFPDVAP